MKKTVQKNKNSGSPKKMHLILCRPGFAGTLASELQDRWGIAGEVVHKAAVAVPDAVKLPPLGDTVFARQYLPLAMRHTGEDAAGVVDLVMARLAVLSKRDNYKPGRWTMHSFAIDDDPGIARGAKLEQAVLVSMKGKMQAVARRHVAPEVFAEGAGEAGDMLIQIFVAGPEEAWVSIAPRTAGMAPHVGGIQRMRATPGAPSRSSSKLSEALEVLRVIGVEPKVGETAVDLGAAPGGWTLVMMRHGVDVTAVDHAELDLPKDKGGKTKNFGRVIHVKENGLKFRPGEMVDWLCCDMVMGSRQTLEVLGVWLKEGLMRNFVVNIKLPQAAENSWPAVKEAFELFEAHRPGWKVMRARHLFHDRNEVTLMGAVKAGGSGVGDVTSA